jgi:excinuclease ABC subunit C
LAFPTDEEDLSLLSAFLTETAGHRVTVSVPERGPWHTMCEMVARNAADRAKQYRLETEKEEGTLGALAELLHLESYPARIEAYDISNLGREFLTAGMIVCKDGRLSRSDYRSFKIRTVEGTDDYASMREAIDRRLSHLSDSDGSFSELPDLILLDGGRGHVSVIRSLLEERGMEIPVFGMVKDDYHKTRALCTDTEEISIARMQEIFLLIYRIQEEVHRYTVGKMEAAKRKTLKTSVLTAIAGIGEKKARILLEAFDGTVRLSTATAEEIAAIKGISARDAAAVWEHFHKSVTEEKENNEGEDERL